MRVKVAIQLASAFLVLACSNATRTQVRTVPDRWEELPPNHSLIVLSRPMKAGWGEAFIVVEDGGKFVADLPAETRVHLVVPAGHHALVGWANKPMEDYLWASRVEIDAHPGGAYFVYVQATDEGLQLVTDPRQGGERRCDWGARALAAKRIAPDQASGQAYLDAEKVAEQIAESRTWLADADTDKGRQILRREQGFPANVLDPKMRGTDPNNWCNAVSALSEEVDRMFKEPKR